MTHPVIHPSFLPFWFFLVSSSSVHLSVKTQASVLFFPPYRSAAVCLSGTPSFGFARPYMSGRQDQLSRKAFDCPSEPNVFLFAVCNRVRDRYEDEVAHTLAQPPQSSRCGRQLCKEHERSNMWYQRELIKNTYSTSAYAGSTARKNLPRLLSTIVT
jgi:hypothetical protein